MTLGATLGLTLAVSGAGIGGVAWARSAPALARDHRPPAYRTVSVPAVSLRVSVPSGWQRYQVTKQTVTEIVSQLKGNPSAIGVVSELEGSFSQYVKFFALDSASHQDLTVLGIPAPAGTTLSELQSAVVPELKTVATNPKVSHTTLGGKTALRIDVSSYNVTAGGQQLPPQAQFYALEGSDAVALDISGANKATINAIVRSVHFTH